MVTIGSGGIPKMGGGMPSMDILKRLKQKMGGMGSSAAGAFNAAPAPSETPTFGGGSMGNPPGVLSLGGGSDSYKPALDMANMPIYSPEARQVTPDMPIGPSGVEPIAPMEQGKRFTDPSITQRMGDFIKSDQGRAALMRSAGATLQGGLGAGIAAATGYIDDEKEKEAKQMNWVSEMGLKTRAQQVDEQVADQTGSYQRARADIDSTQVAINEKVARDNDRKARAAEGIDIMEEGGRNTRFERGDVTDNRRIDANIYGTDASMRNADVSAESSRYATDSSRITADQNRAYQYGDSSSASSKLPNGVNLTVNRRAPDYGENLRYDKAGNPYYRDRLTGKPVRADRR